jgi:hypothetical protein
MTKRGKTILGLFAASLAFCFLFTSLCFGQEMPKPGQVIDKNNYKIYASFIPEELLPGFENGWGGFWAPISMKIVKTAPSPLPKAFLALSEKNRGKYTIDKDGFIAGGYDFEGLPFPGVTPADKDFAIKFMWNYCYRYRLDDWFFNMITYQKRKGESIKYQVTSEDKISFVNRCYDPPKPLMKTPGNLQGAAHLYYYEPGSLRGFQTLSYRYLDPRKPDDTYLYLPTLRRVLRGEAGQRSTPLQGLNSAFDDFTGFDGKTFQFNYKFVKEMKVLGVADSKLNWKGAKQMKAQLKDVLLWWADDWEVKDVYVIDIISKDPKYPQSLKRVYVDKDSYNIYHAAVWDRAGNPWKFWAFQYAKRKVADGDYSVGNLSINFGLDTQLGYAQAIMGDVILNGRGYTYNDFMTSTMLRKGQ